MAHPAFDPSREELVHLAGDAPDPLAGMAGIEHARGGGVTTTMRLTKTAKGHPQIRYRDMLIEADVYAFDGEPVKVHLICPRCRNALSISSDKKSLEYDPRQNVEIGGRLDVETFECTWELPEANDRKMEFGLGLCRWRVAIDNNIARDA